MALVETLPDTLETHGIAPSGEDGWLLGVRSDVDRDGKLAESWILADRVSVRVVVIDNSGPNLLREVAVADLSGAKAENLVGGGALMVQTGSDTIQLARYTTPLAGRMAGAARILDALAKGKDLPEAGLDEIERCCAQCGRALPKDTDVCRWCFDKRATFVRLLSYAKPYRAKAVVLLLLMFAGTWAGLVPGIVVRDLTDNVLLAQGLAKDQRIQSLGILVLWLLASHVVGAAIGVWRGRLSAFLSVNLTYRIRTQLYAKIQQLGLSYYDKRQTGTILTRVTQDVNELNNFLVDGLQILVVNGLTLLGILTILLIQNVKLTLMVLVPVPLVVFATIRIWRFLWGRLERLWHLRSQLAAGINAALSGARVVKAFAQESREVVRFRQRADSLRDVNLDLENWWATLFPILGLIMMSGIFVVWYVGGRDVIGGTMTFGTLNLFFFYLGQLYGPLQGMTRIARKRVVNGNFFLRSM